MQQSRKSLNEDPYQQRRQCNGWGLIFNARWMAALAFKLFSHEGGLTFNLKLVLFVTGDSLVQLTLDTLQLVNQPI